MVWSVEINIEWIYTPKVTNSSFAYLKAYYSQAISKKYISNSQETS